jgi:beta-glucanase (GH16 family)
MMIRCTAALLAGTLLASTTPEPATAQTAGDLLNMQGLNIEIGLNFSRMPAWRKGPVPWPPVAKPFLSPGFQLNASYFSGLRASYSPKASSTFYPAWASLSNELEAYPNGDAMTNLGISPFSIKGSVLSITASPMPAAAKATLPADMQRTYLSGALNTYPFSQTYGYFEINAKVPSGQGLWPAFWLLPVDDSWPPEIDAPEVLGNNTHTAYFSLHTTDGSWVASQPGGYNGSTTTDAFTSTTDLSAGFHRYGVDWGPSQIIFYIDHHVVAWRSTPADMHKPFYLVANLAVGGPGSWPGAPNAATVFPASLQIAGMEIWQRASYATAAAAGK